MSRMIWCNECQRLSLRESNKGRCPHCEGRKLEIVRLGDEQTCQACDAEMDAPSLLCGKCIMLWSVMNDQREKNGEPLLTRDQFIYASQVFGRLQSEHYPLPI